MADPVQQGTTQHISGAGSASFTGTLGGTPASGNILVACITINSPLTTGSPPTQTGVTWEGTARVSILGAAARRAEIWVGTVGAGASATYTLNFSGTAGAKAANVSEWTGYTATADGGTGSASNSASSGAPTITPGATTNANDLIIASVTTNVSLTAPTNSFTALTSETTNTASFLFPSFRIVSATGTYGTAWTGSGNWSMAWIALKQAAAAGTPPLPTVTNFAVARAASY